MPDPSAGPGSRGTRDPALARWHDVTARARRRPVRVVVFADSMGETSFGFRTVWNRIHEAMTLTPPGAWFPPRAMDGLFAWARLPGEPAEIGVDGRGQLLRAGDGAAGVVLPAVVPTTLDLYYTARRDGAQLEVRFDDVVVGVVDTSLDELGVPVDEPAMARRWRSPHLGRMVTWQVEVVGAGVAAVEAVCTPPALGIEVHGSGHSGRPTRALLDSGCATAHLEAMVARGEPPDLVLWAADTAELDASVQLSALEEALEATRRIVPEAVIAHYVPTGRKGWDDSSRRIAAMREIDEARGVLVLDGNEALGDLSPGGPGEHHSYDGVHLTDEGQVAMARALIAKLDPPEQLAAATPWLDTLEDGRRRPVRVVLAADLEGGRQQVSSELWRRLHETVTEPPIGAWSSPGMSGSPCDWGPDAAELVEAGIDGSGVRLTGGVGPIGPIVSVPVPTTLDVYYTARPDGARVDLIVDGAPVARIDTSIDEFGRAVEGPVPAQRLRSPLIAAQVSFQIVAVGAGVAEIEGVGMPPERGIELHGGGRTSPASSPAGRDQVFGHIEAMIARREPPDLVLWAGGAPPPGDVPGEILRTGEALNRIRLLLPDTTVVLCVPPIDEALPEAETFLQLYRGVGSSVRAVVVDRMDAMEASDGLTSSEARLLACLTGG